MAGADSQRLPDTTGFGLLAAFVSVANHGVRPTPDWLMTGLVAMTCALALLVHRAGRLQPWVAVTLLTAGPLAFLSSAWTIDFGMTDPLLWHAITPVSPLLALFVLTPSRAIKAVALAAYAATAGATAVVVAPTSGEAAAIIVIGALGGIGMTLGVASFVRTLNAVVARAASEPKRGLRPAPGDHRGPGRRRRPSSVATDGS